jgi:hypothetical protein
MADYLLLYEGGDPKWLETAPSEDVQAVMAQWGAWFKELESKGVLRNPGSALASGGATLQKKGDDFVTDTTMAEVKELIGGFSIIQAGSIEEAARIAEGSPLFNEEADDLRIRIQAVFEPEGSQT